MCFALDWKTGEGTVPVLRTSAWKTGHLSNLTGTLTVICRGTGEGAKEGLTVSGKKTKEISFKCD